MKLKFTSLVLLALIHMNASRSLQAQIWGQQGDGVLNAPYRGPVESLRKACEAIPYGETFNLAVPSKSTTQIAGDITISLETGSWDRSVLRLYHGIDASSDEIDLTNGPVTFDYHTYGDGNGVNRFSVRAMGTRNLSSTVFKLKFSYHMYTGSSHCPDIVTGLTGPWKCSECLYHCDPDICARECRRQLLETSFTFTVAPVMTSISGFAQLAVPVLDLSAGNARLSVAIGHGADALGLAGAMITRHSSCKDALQRDMPVIDAILPGVASSVYVPDSKQFEVVTSPFNKEEHSAPWPGFLRGYYYDDQENSIHAPDGTVYELDGSSGFCRLSAIHHVGVDADDPSAVQYEYDSRGRVTRIYDHPGGNESEQNAITLDYSVEGRVDISTSYDPQKKWRVNYDLKKRITSVVPPDGLGARYFTWLPADSPLSEGARVSEVRSAPGTKPLYQFRYVNNSPGQGLLAEYRSLTADPALDPVKVVEYPLPAPSLPDLLLRQDYVGSDFRVTAFEYGKADDDTGTQPMHHRLKKVTEHQNTHQSGGGPTYETKYDYKLRSLVPGDAYPELGQLLSITSPDGLKATYGYDSGDALNPSGQLWHRFGFLSKITLTKGTQSKIAYDVDYDFLHSGEVYFSPRIVKSRDAMASGASGTDRTVVYTYEAGGQDQNGDGITGEVSNLLLSRHGPVVTLFAPGGGQRNPTVTYEYYTAVNDGRKGLLKRVESFDANDTSKKNVVDFDYDELRRISRKVVDPGSPPSHANLITDYQYNDDQPTQDYTVIEPGGIQTVTRYDPDGRVQSIDQSIDTTQFRRTTYEYGVDGLLEVEWTDRDPRTATSTPAILKTEYTRDRIGRVLSKVADSGGIGQTTTYAYTYQNELEKVMDSDQRGAQRTYDGRGLVDTETPLKLHGVPETTLTKAFTYDPAGRLLTTEFKTQPSREKIKRVYDVFGRLSEQHRLPGSVGGSTIKTIYQYDANDRVTEVEVDEVPSPGTTILLSLQSTLYDEAGLAYSITHPGDESTESRLTYNYYDWTGNLLLLVRKGDQTTGDRDQWVQRLYDSAHRLAFIRDSEDGETEFRYGDKGDVIKKIVKLDTGVYAETDIEWDDLHRPIKIIDPVEGGRRNYRTHQYDARSNLLRETVFEGSASPGQGGAPILASAFEYDAVGRRVTEGILANPAAVPGYLLGNADRVTRYGFDKDGRLESRSVCFSPVLTTEVKYTYDDLGNVWKVETPSGITTNGYSAAGLLDTRTTNDGKSDRVFTFTYDAHDRVASVSEGLGVNALTTTYKYDGLDRVKTLIDPKMVAQLTTYNLLGEAISVAEASGDALQRTTSYAYNTLGQMIRQTAENRTSTGQSLSNQVTEYRYDTLGRKTLTSFPHQSAAIQPDPLTCVDCIRSTYDKAGRLQAQTDQANQTVTFDYTSTGLLKSRSLGAQGLDSYTHDAAGRLVTADHTTPLPVSQVVRQYTTLGDLEWETQKIAASAPRQVTYAHNQGGARTLLQYPGSEQFQFLQRPSGELDQILQNNKTLVDYDYFGDKSLPQSRTTTTVGANPTQMKTVFDYDAFRRVNSISNLWGGTQEIVGVHTQYDANGNPKLITTTGQPQFAGDIRDSDFDNLNRLLSTTYADRTEAITLDLAGNREKYVGREGKEVLYTLADQPGAGANQYATIDGKPVVYDAKGNVQRDEDGRWYYYDLNNRLTGIRAPDNAAVLASYDYDALGRRIQSTISTTVTRYYFDGNRVIEEYGLRSGGEYRLRYHVDGAHYIDEHIITHADPDTANRLNYVGQGNNYYYLAGNNNSVAGIVDADGNATRLDYSSTGDFAGGAVSADFDGDHDVDNADFTHLRQCAANGADHSPPAADVAGRPCQDTDLDRDTDVDGSDLVLFQVCMSGEGVPPPPQCAGGAPPSGTYTLHGLPVDVLPDGHAFLFARARFYDLKNGRWLQRDPMGYVDGGNLYEAFKGNPLTNVDPEGKGILTGLLVGDSDYDDWQFIKEGGITAAVTGMLHGPECVAVGAKNITCELVLIPTDIAGLAADTGSGVVFDTSLNYRVRSSTGRFFDSLSCRPRELTSAGIRCGIESQANVWTFGLYNTGKGTLELIQTGDVDKFAKEVGGQNAVFLLVYATAPKISSAVARMRHSGTIGESPLAGAPEIQSQLKTSVAAVKRETAWSSGIVRHPFARGATHITTLGAVKSAAMKYTQFGRPTGLYVAPTEQIDALLAQAASLEEIEIALGLEKGSLSGRGAVVRIDIAEPFSLDLRLPDPATGNSLHLPNSGITLGGLNEAVVNPIPHPNQPVIIMLPGQQ